MKYTHLFIIISLFTTTTIMYSCKKDPENEVVTQECESRKTGIIRMTLSGRLSIDPVDVYIDNEFIDSLQVYLIDENKNDIIELTKPIGKYVIEYREKPENGGGLLQKWDTTLNICEKMEISYYKAR